MTKIISSMNIPSLSNAPSFAEEGNLYYNTVADKTYFYNGSSWVALKGNSASYGPVAPIGKVAGDIWIDSSSSQGINSLSNSTSSSSTINAATANSVLELKKDIYINQYGNPNYVFSCPPMLTGSSGIGFVSGQVSYVKIVSMFDLTVSSFSTYNNTSVTTVPALTLCRMGLYTRSGSTFTLQARTASLPSFFNAPSQSRITAYFDTAGGYPATYNLVAGQSYWVAIIVVGTTLPSQFSPTNTPPQGFGTATGNQGSYVRSGQTDLLATDASASIIAGGAQRYWEVG